MILIFFMELYVVFYLIMVYLISKFLIYIITLSLFFNSYNFLGNYSIFFSFGANLSKNLMKLVNYASIESSLKSNTKVTGTKSNTFYLCFYIFLFDYTSQC